MVALFGYCTEFSNSGTTGICPEKNPFDHVSLSDEETRDVKKELDDIDNKFYDARANANWGLISQRALVCKPGLSIFMLRSSEYNIVNIKVLLFVCLG